MPRFIASPAARTAQLARTAARTAQLAQAGAQRARRALRAAATGLIAVAVLFGMAPNASAAPALAAPALAAAEGASAAGSSAAAGLRVVSLAVGRGVEARQLVGQSDRFAVDGGRLWAHVALANPGAPTTVTMIWRRGGTERFRTELAVGTSPAWRTWSRVTPSPKRDVGTWEVQVLDAAGSPLGSVSVEVVAPESGELGRVDPTEGEFGC